MPCRTYHPSTRSTFRKVIVSGKDPRHRSSLTYFNFRKASIYGGSNEIQKNIIAKHVLGL